MIMTESTKLLFVARCNNSAKPLGVFDSEALAIQSIQEHYEGAHPGERFEDHPLHRYGVADFASSGDLILKAYTRPKGFIYEVFAVYLNVPGFKVVTTIA
jgi:hypothetical protein